MKKGISLLIDGKRYDFEPVSEDDAVLSQIDTLTVTIDRTNLPKNTKILLKEITKDNQ